MKSTLVEPPPESDGLDEETAEFVRADSVSELAEKTNIGNEEVLDRVLLPGKRFGDYHILGFVAAGGMGEIYAAERIKSDGSRSRPVALKVITDEYANDWRIIERFKREARISKAIRSRHVARVYEFGESPQGHAFLSMELLNGEELFDRLHRNKVLPAMTVAELTLQILKGLHQIHKSGFVHRDIKPENVFLAEHPDSGDEEVKIIDFGVAKRADEKSDPLLSVAGQIYGTPQYIAPEQAVDPNVDHRADLYSLGCVMYECVTGSLPFPGESSYDIIVAHQEKQVPAMPSSVDPAFADIVYQVMAKDPDERFQSAVEMGRVLKRWVDETSWVEEAGPDDELTLESPDSDDAHLGAPAVEAGDEDQEADADLDGAGILQPPSVDRSPDASDDETRVDDLAVDAPTPDGGDDEESADELAPDFNIGGSGEFQPLDEGLGAEASAPPNLEDTAGETTSTDSTEPAPSNCGDEASGPEAVPPNLEVDQSGSPQTVDQPDPPATTSPVADRTEDASERRIDETGPTSVDSQAETTIDDTDNRPARDSRPEAFDESADEDRTDEISPPSDITSELRNPRAKTEDAEATDSDARSAQIITGIALGMLILAILWTVLL